MALWVPLPLRPLLIRTRCIIPLFILITPLRLPEIVSLIVCDPVRTPKADAYMHILLSWWGALPLHNCCVWKVRDGVEFSDLLLLSLSLSLSLSLFYLPNLSFYKQREGERVCAQQPNLISLGTPPHYKQEAAPSVVSIFPLQPCIQDATKPSLMMQQINHTPHNPRPE